MEHQVDEECITYCVLQGNEIIERIQQESRTLKAKLKMKAKIIKQQEQVLNARAFAAMMPWYIYLLLCVLRLWKRSTPREKS